MIKAQLFRVHKEPVEGREGSFIKLDKLITNISTIDSSSIYSDFIFAPIKSVQI